MKPIAIFRHAAVEGPGYLGEFLSARNIPWILIAIDAGEMPPLRAAAYAGLVFMGGPMSVNDDLPWVVPALALIREAVARDIPVLGHCLGGQLMAKALGGVVSRNQYKEIGWGLVTVADNPTAHAWFGDVRTFISFHWHGETFTLPQGAMPVLSSPACINQGFVLGKHLALQCHVEMTQSMVQDWCRVGKDELASVRNGQYVQSVGEMQSQSKENITEMRKIATLLYTKWLAGALDSARS
jgi:GMP synthase-like glutamine amidotransferase